MSAAEGEGGRPDINEAQAGDGGGEQRGRVAELDVGGAGDHAGDVQEDG